MLSKLLNFSTKVNPESLATWLHTQKERVQEEKETAQKIS